jgi:hypothetical protein
VSHSRIDRDFASRRVPSPDATTQLHMHHAIDIIDPIGRIIGVIRRP